MFQRLEAARLRRRWAVYRRAMKAYDCAPHLRPAIYWADVEAAHLALWNAGVSVPVLAAALDRIRRLPNPSKLPQGTGAVPPPRS